MREKKLHLDGRAVCLQVLQSRKQPLQRVWISKMSSFPRLELRKNTKIHARRGCAVHQRSTSSVGYATGTARNAKVFGTRQSRWNIWGIEVRQFPRLRAFSTAQRTPHRRTPPRDTTPKEPFWQVRGWGENTFFWYFWAPEKIRGASRHRGVAPWT